MGLSMAPTEVLQRVSAGLDAATAVALAGACIGMREEILNSTSARRLWEQRASADFGDGAHAVATRLSGPAASGAGVYSACLSVRQAFSESIDVVDGSVSQSAADVECVACPVVGTLHNVGIGAQGAVRRAAGPALETFIDDFRSKPGFPLSALDVVIAPGGRLCTHVALVVTEPPAEWMWQSEVTVDEATEFLISLHRRLLGEVRKAGCRRLAMPTLGTGGMGMHPRMVCKAVARACAEDLALNPNDPIFVRVACFEREHALEMRMAAHFETPRLFSSE
eukprot:gnl/TRDRNA2_/TRDRNA2_200439_c0_seq1.p1 gnl/TRDRNA2_/TRDRNA2_200439_c0~~gnl/TRDRNA2_/TRDRNA2_200439_c0_seq1.p1  ORF type:complete len:304 (-),score=47.07 gnl/TRDRNA2_/TRDRNA2_200439_c0_seq1:35-874(-)